MAANARVDELRKRLEREPGSRLFAQYAEELRRAGDLEEAVKVCREGLTKHPGYPSARITLGRALLDLGAVSDAGGEFAAVLEGAPDNLSASRYLGECLEKAGDTAEALKRYQTALLHSPGDEWMRSRVAALAGGEGAGGAQVAGRVGTVEPKGPPPLPGAPGGARGGLGRALEEVAPVGGLVGREGVETSRPGGVGAPARADDEKPIPLVAVDDDSFEIERPHEAAGSATGRTAMREAEVAAPRYSAVPEDEEYDLETSGPPPAAPGARELTFRPLLLDETEGAQGLTTGASAATELPPMRVAGPAGGRPELASATLAELYLKQGAIERAVAIYEELAKAEPDNRTHAESLAQARTRLASAPGQGGRKARTERVVRRLERALASIEAGRQHPGSRG